MATQHVRIEGNDCKVNQPKSTGQLCFKCFSDMIACNWPRLHKTILLGMPFFFFIYLKKLRQTDLFPTFCISESTSANQNTYLCMVKHINYVLDIPTLMSNHQTTGSYKDNADDVHVTIQYGFIFVIHFCFAGNKERSGPLLVQLKTVFDISGINIIAVICVFYSRAVPPVQHIQICLYRFRYDMRLQQQLS